MGRKKIKILGTLYAVILISIGIFWFFFQPSDDFLSEKEIIQKVNRDFADANIEVLQDTIYLNEELVYVPFISSKDKYGVSLWEWSRGGWRLAYIDTSGKPQMIKAEESDPATYQFIWNIHPDDTVEYAMFYLLRERNFHSSSEGDFYNPKIQMDVDISFENRTYGVEPIPVEWAQHIEGINEVMTIEQSGFYMGHYIPELHSYGMILYDSDGNETDLEKTMGNSSFSTGDFSTPIISVDPAEIRRP